MGAITRKKSTPVPPGAGSVRLVDITEGVESIPFVSPIVDLGSPKQDNEIILLGTLDDSSQAGNCNGIVEAATNPDGPWWTVATLSKAEFSLTTSDGANTGWYERGTTLNAMPAKYMRYSISGFTLTGQNLRLWIMWSNQP